MTVTIKTLRSGMGDCIFHVLKEEGQQFVIMVDCGNYQEPIILLCNKLLFFRAGS